MPAATCAGARRSTRTASMKGSTLLKMAASSKAPNSAGRTPNGTASGQARGAPAIKAQNITTVRSELSMGGHGTAAMANAG